jgi:hypothetical protein
MYQSNEMNFKIKGSLLKRNLILSFLFKVLLFEVLCSRLLPNFCDSIAQALFGVLQFNFRRILLALLPPVEKLLHDF